MRRLEAAPDRTDEERFIPGDRIHKIDRRGLLLWILFVLSSG